MNNLAYSTTLSEDEWIGSSFIFFYLFEIFFQINVWHVFQRQIYNLLSKAVGIKVQNLHNYKSETLF